jgi:hypothetical protein
MYNVVQNIMQLLLVADNEAALNLKSFEFYHTEHAIVIDWIIFLVS